MKRKDLSDILEPEPKRRQGLPFTTNTVDGGNGAHTEISSFNQENAVRAQQDIDCHERELSSGDTIELLSSSSEGQAEGEEDEGFCEIVSPCTNGVPAKPAPLYGRGEGGAQRAPQAYDLTSDDTPGEAGTRRLPQVVHDLTSDDAQGSDASAGPSAPVYKGGAGAAARQPPPSHQHDFIALDLDADSPASGPAPISATCPGCQADGKDTVRKQSLLTAMRQLCAEATVSEHLPQHRAPNATEAEAEAVAAVAGGPLCCSSCRRLAALAVVEAAQQHVRAIVGRHSTAAMTAIQGMVFEVHHTASFNISAIRAGSLLRAERVEYNSADVRIYSITDPRVTLALAQLKASANRQYLRKLNLLKYENHLKVVPQGFEVPASGRRSVLSCGDVSSTSISLSALEAAVLMPGDHFFDLAWTEEA